MGVGKYLLTMKYAVVLVVTVGALAISGMQDRIPREPVQMMPREPIYDKADGLPGACTFSQHYDQQVTFPYDDYNGMTDSDGNWKYCWESDPEDALKSCLNWCLQNVGRGCVGVTQDDHNDSDFFFPVTTLSDTKCSNGISFWDLDCHYC